LTTAVRELRPEISAAGGYGCHASLAPGSDFDAAVVILLDNLKEGVLTPDIYDPTLNPLELECSCLGLR
jgi:hypothetical protein